METTLWLLLAIAALVAYVFVLGLFEVYYFITLGLTAFVARFFKKRTHIMDMTTVTRKFGIKREVRLRYTVHEFYVFNTCLRV